MVKVAAVGAIALVGGAVLAVAMLAAFLGGLARDAASGAAGVVCAAPGAGQDRPVAGLTPGQLRNAAAIVAVGVEVKAPTRAKVIALATAVQESQLWVYANSTVPESLELVHDRVGNDHDSVGLYQQRGGWGSVAQRMDPRASALLFYEQLLAVPGWEALPLTVAAQTVQRSAFPDAYARWEQRANEIVGAVSGIVCSPTPGDGNSLPPNPLAQPLMDRALSQLGVPYVWGGGNGIGPTGGGFDCSGLMQFAHAGIGVHVPHQTQAIWEAFQPAITDPAQVQPGDMILLSDNGLPTGIHHVGLYLGSGRVVHAPQTGSTVEIVENVWNSTYWREQFIGAVRALPATDRRG